MRENTGDYRYIVCVEGIVHNDGKYLMITRSEKEIHAPGTISFPGGKVEVDQPASGILEEAVRREILEETGIIIKPAMKILKNKFFFLMTVTKLSTSFFCASTLPVNLSSAIRMKWLRSSG